MKIKGVVNATRRVNQGLRKEAISDNVVISQYSHYWNSFDPQITDRTITFPDATQLENGWAVIIHHSGTANDLIVNSINLSEIKTIKPIHNGNLKAYKFVLTDNSTSDGSWEVIELVDIELFQLLSDDNQSPHGFINPLATVNPTFNDLTRTLTLSPIGPEYVFWSSGKRFKKTEADSIVIDDITSNYYVYYNDSGELVSSNTFNLDMIVKYAIVAVIYWNAEQAKHILFCHEYLHTTEMGGMTHARLHLVDGFSLESGGALGNFVFGNGNLNSHIQFSNELTVAWDEDARCNLLPRLSTDNISVYWKEGSEANPIWKVKEDTSFPIFIETGNTYPSYNQLVAGNWQLTQLGNNNHMLIHVAGNNDLNRRFMVFLGQENYGSSVTNVRQNATEELDSLILEGMIAPEFRFLGTIIVQATGNNDVNARFIAIDAETAYIDWRSVSVGRGGVSGTVVDHEQLANRNVDDAHKSFAISYDNTNSSLSATNVEDALDELDYEKLNSSAFDTHTNDNTIHYTQEEITISASQVNDLPKSDWTEENTESNSFILNKPTNIYAITVESDIEQEIWEPNINYTKAVTVMGAEVGDTVSINVTDELFVVAIESGDTMVLNASVTAPNQVTVWARRI